MLMLPKHHRHLLQDFNNLPMKPVVIHRAIIKEDLIRVFKDPDVVHYNIDVTLIGNNGKEEEGKGVGVFRDV